MLVPLGSEWWAEPVEQPADRDTLATYNVDPEVLNRWRKARDEYLSARAALVGAVERQGWRAQPAGNYVDLVFTDPPGPWQPRLLDVEDEQSRSTRYGEWLQRDDGRWVLRIPKGS